MVRFEHFFTVVILSALVESSDINPSEAVVYSKKAERDYTSAVLLLPSGTPSHRCVILCLTRLARVNRSYGPARYVYNRCSTLEIAHPAICIVRYNVMRLEPKFYGRLGLFWYALAAQSTRKGPWQIL